MKSKRGSAGIVALVLLAVVAVVGIWGVNTYNRIIRLHEQVPAAWGQVENVLQRRNDLIPNLVATVKGFAKQEQTIYGDISKALAAFNRAQTVNEKVAADNTIGSLLQRIMAVSLQYPQLQSNQNFQRLQDELAGTENRIAVERRQYNLVVQEYNTLVKTFPSSAVARYAKLSQEQYFKAEEPAKVAPKVEF